ncbi:MAG: hypothetical protein RMM58_08295 [Chloroflexota bacterium]|nr:hypothetical protein [Dehalococcoidia bacterium]MDW8253863.1 hypothetical protein [Chloroflexota bacterium]
MSIRRASALWDGPAEDVLWLLIDPLPEFWSIEPVDQHGRVALLRALDERELPTEELAGIEVAGFLSFEAWDSLPDLPGRWAIDGDEPRPLVEALRRVQAALRGQLLPAGDGAADLGEGSR